MAGGLIQLTAYGAQNIYLIENPSITFFKKVYRKYSNFACENINVQFDKIPSFRGSQVTATCTIPRSGDLVRNIYLRLSIPDVTDSGNFLWARNLGSEFIKSIKILIGGNLIDTIPEHWITIWNELTLNSSMKKNYNFLTGNVPEYHTYRGDKTGRNIFIPLPLFFSGDPGLSIPLVALQYHELEIQFEFRNITEMYSGTPVETLDITEISLDIEYIFLDSEERNRFAKVDHQYLINTLQFTKFNNISQNSNLELKFNHPIKELIFILQRDDVTNQQSNFTSNLKEEEGNHMLTTGNLQVNGYDRFELINFSHFSGIQVLQHHSNYPTIEYCDTEIISHELTLDSDNSSIYHANSYLAIPYNMDLVGIQGIINGTIDQNITISFSKNSTSITNGDLSFTASGSAAGDVTSSTPTANHNFTSSDFLKITISGSNTLVVNCNLTLKFQKRSHYLKEKKGIYVYSFGFKPEEFQPSGAMNFSMLNNVYLKLNHSESTNINCFVYAVTHNILRVIAGLGNKVFAN
jgi:hypothetical protein